MNHQNIFNSITAICNFFYRKEVPAEHDEELQFWLSPAAGLLPGLAAAIFGAVFVFFMGDFSGGIISALVLPLFFEILTGWRGLDAVIAVLDQKLSGKRFTQISAFEKLNVMSRPQTMILFFSVYVFRMVCFGFLAASGNAVWFIYAFGGAYLIRGELYTDEVPELEDQKYWNWVVYLFCIAAAALFSFHWSAIYSLPVAVVGTILILIGIRKFFENLSVPHQSWMYDFWGYVAESGLLLIGLILFGRSFNG